MAEVDPRAKRGPRPPFRTWIFHVFLVNRLDLFYVILNRGLERIGEHFNTVLAGAERLAKTIEQLWGAWRIGCPFFGNG